MRSPLSIWTEITERSSLSVLVLAAFGLGTMLHTAFSLLIFIVRPFFRVLVC